jgi:hypothetical protein
MAVPILVSYYAFTKYEELQRISALRIRLEKTAGAFEKLLCATPLERKGTVHRICI